MIKALYKYQILDFTYLDVNARSGGFDLLNAHCFCPPTTVGGGINTISKHVDIIAYFDYHTTEQLQKALIK